MKSLLSVLAICLTISFISCGGGDDCLADYVGTWNGSINCSGSSADSITIDITQMAGDTLSVIANGDRLTGILSGCDLELEPKEFDLSIFGTITISGSFEIKNDELVFTQMRTAGEDEETCTFVGKK